MISISPGRKASHVLIRIALATMLIAAGNSLAAQDERAGKPPFIASGSSIFRVFANPVEGQDAGFNEWYDRHAKAVVQLPGFLKVQRFRMQPREGRVDPRFRYVIIYEVSMDPSAVHVRIADAVRAGTVESPDKRYVAEFEAMVYGPITPVW